MTDDGDAALAAALDELGDAPLDRFVATRDRLARTLKADGHADAAKALRARRRPSVVAWSVNRVARERPDLVASLFTAADDVRAAVERGDGDALRAAMRAQRTRLAELTDATVERTATVSPNAPAHEDAITRTWEAAADDEGVRDAVTSGALVGELQPGTTLNGTPTEAPTASARTATGGAQRSRLPRSGATSAIPASSTRPRDELALRRAEDAVTEARETLAEARRAAITARKDAARAERAAARADDEEARARRRLTSAEDALAERRSR